MFVAADRQATIIVAKANRLKVGLKLIRGKKETEMSNLNTRTKKVAGVIMWNDENGLDYDTIAESLLAFDIFCKTMTERYAWIVHDLDQLEDGTFKNYHVHFVFDLLTPVRLSTTLYNLSEFCGLNPLAISLEKYTSFVGSFQYLVHRNDWEKVQYLADQIHASFGRKDILDLLAMDDEAFDIEALVAIVQEARSLTDVARRVGIKFYRTYRFVIRDIWCELHNSYNEVLNGAFKSQRAGIT